MTAVLERDVDASITGRYVIRGDATRSSETFNTSTARVIPFQFRGQPSTRRLGEQTKNPESETASDGYTTESRTKKIPKSVQEIIDGTMEVLEYAKLLDGWDGEGSLAPSKNVIIQSSMFRVLLPLAVSPPDSAPNDDGSISWYWQTPKGMGSATIKASGRLTYFIRTKNGEIKDDVPFLGDSLPNELIEMTKYL
tara:strand:- start:82 stop:666 length:585 start_codon:yes stop_codon:yes gene_type:complete